MRGRSRNVRASKARRRGGAAAVLSSPVQCLSVNGAHARLVRLDSAARLRADARTRRRLRQRSLPRRRGHHDPTY